MKVVVEDVRESGMTDVPCDVIKVDVKKRKRRVCHGVCVLVRTPFTKTQGPKLS